MANKPTPLKENSQIQLRQEAFFSGPLPPPEALSRYEKVLPGAADRIVAMAEKQSAHRIEIEKITIKARARDSLLGVVSGFLIGVTALLVCAYNVTSGYPFSGSLIGASGLGGLVGVFVYGTRESRAERERKNKERVKQKEPSERT